MAGGLERRLGQLEAAAAARMERQGEPPSEHELLRRLAFLIALGSLPEEQGKQYGERYEDARQVKAMFEEKTGMSAEEVLGGSTEAAHDQRD